MTDKYILVGRNPFPVLNTRAWAAWFEQSDRRVALTLLCGIEVSTAFLGLDHNWSGGRPLLFETMAFGANAELVDLVGQRRCSTWAEAEAQHERALAEVRAWKEPTMTETPQSRGGREFAAAARPGRLVPALLAIATATVFLSRKVQQVTTALENLTSAVHQAETVAQSAVTLISGLSGQLRAAKDDPDAVDALATELEASTSQLSIALTANTANAPVVASTSAAAIPDPALAATTAAGGATVVAAPSTSEPIVAAADSGTVVDPAPATTTGG